MNDFAKQCIFKKKKNVGRKEKTANLLENLTSVTRFSLASLIVSMNQKISQENKETSPAKTNG